MGAAGERARIKHMLERPAAVLADTAAVNNTSRVLVFYADEIIPSVDIPILHVRATEFSPSRRKPSTT